MANTVQTSEVIINDSIDLHGAPHAVRELLRESLSVIPEKTDEELYVQSEETADEEQDSTPSTPSEDQTSSTPSTNNADTSDSTQTTTTEDNATQEGETSQE